MSINDRDEDAATWTMPVLPAVAKRDEEHSILTFTGKRVWPLDPRVEDIDIRDIAHALSHSCRFTGHVRKFYSVAQHCVLASQKVPAEHALTALLHDASEAYLSDIARPVKRQDGFAFYRQVEEKLERVIAEKFHLPFPFPVRVKDVDTRLLATERRDLMPKSSDGAWPKTKVSPAYPEVIQPWEPGRAKQAFLDRFATLVTGGLTVRVLHDKATDEDDE